MDTRMSYDYLSQAEQDEMYDLKFIINMMTNGLLNIVSLRTLHFDHNDPYEINWAVKRLHQLRKRNSVLEIDAKYAHP